MTYVGRNIGPHASHETIVFRRIQRDIAGVTNKNWFISYFYISDCRSYALDTVCQAAKYVSSIFTSKSPMSEHLNPVDLVVFDFQLCAYISPQPTKLQVLFRNGVRQLFFCKMYQWYL